MRFVDFKKFVSFGNIEFIYEIKKDLDNNAHYKSNQTKSKSDNENTLKQVNN